jgi:LacI family transcriptional regulator
MSDQIGARRATVHDVARQAGVSLATVDRVLNGRPGVRPQTTERVESAIAALDFRRDLSASLLARARDLKVLFLIPDGANEFMENLAEAIAQRGWLAASERMLIQTVKLKALDPAALVSALNRLDAKSCDCAIIIAIEDDAVIGAVDAATRRGITILTLVSDLPGSSRRHFIGIDNGAAGRTAASLMGRFCPNGGKIGLIAGSLGLRDHRERLEAFMALAEAEFPGLALIGPLEGHDDPDQTEKLVADLLKAHPDLSGLYNLGAGNGGLLRALDGSGRARSIRVIAHELTGPTREGLRSGSIDIVLDQNPDSEIRAAIAAARQLALGVEKPLAAFRQDEPIEIGIFLRDNLR